MFKTYNEIKQTVRAFHVRTLADAAALIEMAPSCDAEVKVENEDFTLRLFHRKTGREIAVRRGDYFIQGDLDESPQVVPYVEFRLKWAEA